MELHDYKNRFKLRTINIEDIELLREWKNQHRSSFFHKEMITSEQQKDWYYKYSVDEDNVMFIVVNENGESIGCMGYRKIDSGVDVYNIMRGVKEKNASFKMKEAFLVMLEYIHKHIDDNISCVVLNNNPAFNWYLSMGFILIKRHLEYSTLAFNKNRQEDDYSIWLTC